MSETIMDEKVVLPRVYKVIFHKRSCSDARCDGCAGRKPILLVRGAPRDGRRS